jgi:hypothetical protein
MASQIRTLGALFVFARDSPFMVSSSALDCMGLQFNVSTIFSSKARLGRQTAGLVDRMRELHVLKSARNLGD